MKKIRVYFPLVVVLVASVLIFVVSNSGTDLNIPVTGASPTATIKAARTSTRVVTATAAHTRTATPTPSPTLTQAAPATDTSSPVVTITQAITITPDTNPDVVLAYPDAPPCPTHDPTIWHALWDSEYGCHFNHEHGADPFTPLVANIFARLSDLHELLCGLEISHCVPSSPMENTMKHTGHKWQVSRNPNGCFPFAGMQANVTIGVDFMAMQYHNFSPYYKGAAMPELDSRTHSMVGAFRQCKQSNPNDFGYMWIEQLQDFGPILKHYQGPRLNYPQNPDFYAVHLAPYIAGHCIFGDGCRTSLAQAQANNSNCIWTSDPDNVAGSKLFAMLFRCKDSSQMVDGRDTTYPYTAYWLCTADGGLTFKQEGCKNNSSTSTIHEITGVIPSSWDNDEDDSDPRVGRITATFYVTRFGERNPACTTYSLDCQRIVLVEAFVGKYGAQWIDGKIPQFSDEAQPDRDICFLNNVAVPCSTSGSIPSGWIGAEN